MVTKAKAKKPEVGLSAPWQTIQHEIFHLLEPDKEVTVSEVSECDNGVYSVDISSKNGKKIAALEKVIKNSFNLGNVQLVINFIHEREDDDVTVQDYIDAFEGNSNFVTVEETSKGLFQNLVYVIFAKEILQFFNDQLDDVYGNKNIIVADAANDVCNKNSKSLEINFCTANGTETN